MRSKSFLAGFGVGILVFVSLNIYSTFPEGPGFSFDSYETFGFPFDMHESGTIAHLDQFIWSGVVANITVAFLGSLLLGLMFAYAAKLFRSNALGLD